MSAVYVQWLLPGLWLVVLVGLAAHAVRCVRGATWGERAAGVTLVAVSAGLRGWLSPWGWADLRNSVTSGLDGVGALSWEGNYGPAVDVWVALLTSLGFRGLLALEWSGLLASAVSPLLLAGLVRAVGGTRQAGYMAAALLCASPLHVRMAPTVNRYSLLLPLALWSLTVLAQRCRGALPRSGRRLWLMVAGLGLVLATACRPDALWLPLAAAALLVSLRGWRRPPRDVLWVAAVCGALLAPHAARLLGAVFSAPEFDGVVHPRPDAPPLRGVLAVGHNLLLTDRYVPVAWAVLAVIGAADAVARRRRGLMWLGLTALLGTAFVSLEPIDRDMLNARYQLLSSALAFGVAGSGLAALARRVAWPPPLRRVLVVCVAALGVIPGVPLWQETTLDQEVRFLRRALATVPDECEVRFLNPMDHDLSLRPSRGLSLSAGRSHRWLQLPSFPLETQAPCALWYRGSACQGEIYHPPTRGVQAHVCQTMDRRAREPHAHAVLVNRPAGAHLFRGRTVRVGLYWLRKPPELAAPAARPSAAD